MTPPLKRETKKRDIRLSLSYDCINILQELADKYGTSKSEIVEDLVEQIDKFNLKQG